MRKKNYDILVGFRTKSLNNRLKELPDTFKDNDLEAWCTAFALSIHAVQARSVQLQQKNVIGVHDIIGDNILDAEWANWRSSWLSTRDVVAFTKEHPDVSVASAGIGDMLQLARDGYRGFRTLNMSLYTQTYLVGTVRAVVALTTLKPGSFLGVIPGWVRYGRLPSELLSPTNNLAVHIPGPSELWLERINGMLGLLYRKPGKVSNVVLGWETWDDPRYPDCVSFRVCAFARSLILAFEELSL